MTRAPPSREVSPFIQSLKTLVRAVTAIPESEREPESETSLSLDEALDLLGPRRRRAVIEQLAHTNEHQGHIAVADLAEEIACAEYECLPSELGSDERKRIYIALTQSHLPRLENADIVDYESNGQIVRQGPAFEQLWRAYSALRVAIRNQSG